MTDIPNQGLRGPQHLASVITKKEGTLTRRRGYRENEGPPKEGGDIFTRRRGYPNKKEGTH